MANYIEVERPHLFPQRTIFTGDPREIPVIDTGVNDVEGGRIYISFGELDEIATKFGYVKASELDLRDEVIKIQQEQLEQLPDLIEKVIDGIRTVVSDSTLALISLATDGSDPAAPVSVEAHEVGDEAVGGDDTAPSEPRRSRFRSAGRG